jgi:CheY-like chemotaxis protein
MNENRTNYSLVMVLDPRPAYIRMLKRALAPRGYTVIGTTNGREGVNLFDRTGPQVVMIDPDASGSRALLNRTGNAFHTTVILVTRSERVAGLVDIEKVDGVIFKDEFFFDTLLSFLDSLNQLAAFPVRTAESRKRRLLIVDAYPDAAELYSTFLASLGYDTMTARSGTEALERIERGDRVDAVLLDVTTPAIDGLRTLERLRRVSSPPGVLTVGASGVAEFNRRAHRLGAYDYLVKPVDLARLEAAVAGCIANRDRKDDERRGSHPLHPVVRAPIAGTAARYGAGVSRTDRASDPAFSSPGRRFRRDRSPVE